MTGILAGIIATLVAWGLHVLIGDHVSMMTDFVVTTIASGIAYIVSFWWLIRMKGG